MDKPADPPINPTPITTNGADLRSPEQKAPRRRFVQSTLFPLKPHDNKSDNSGKKEVKKFEEINIVDVVDDDDDVVECSGSQTQSGKKKRGRPRKLNSTPQKRKPKKVADTGKDEGIVSIDDTESPDDGSPQQPKEKQHTPAKKGRSGSKKTSMAKTPPRQVAAHQIPQTVPDLWQEAKKTSEENSRIFAGKQIHPFFSSWKAGKKDQEIIEVETYGCLDKQKDKNAEFNPIHVFEGVKDNVELNDWSNWNFYDGPFSNTFGDQGIKISSFEGTAFSLNYDTGIILNNCGTSLLPKDVSSSQDSRAAESNLEIPIPGSPVVVDEEVTPVELLQNIKKELVESELFISGDNEHLNSDLKQQDFLQDRIRSYYLNRGDQPKNSLWTNKYQPEKASEVCGNSEAVKSMNDWLRLWSAADFHFRKKSCNADNLKYVQYDSNDSDSDAENTDEPSGLKNVLLVSGPVGSGKSAAIYACAKEQGFEVIEVNASDWRNGAILKQKFGEAVGLHWLKWSHDNHVGSQSKLDFKSSSELRHGELNNDAVEEISLSEEEYVGGVGIKTDIDGRLCINQGEIKTLILFEDVDATLCEDRGFISTIQQLANTGKRPMILTSSNENPELPENLDREEISFTIPSLKELICHIYLVCAVEKANLQPHLIERCIEFCGGDIRKSLMHLQFWCQRKGCVKGGEIQSMHSPLMFSLAAIHCTLPRLIPLGLPSSLSEFIEAEIAKSLCRVEESQHLVDVLEEDDNNVEIKLDIDDKGEAAVIEAKKEAILRGNCFSHVDDDSIAVSSFCEFSNCSGSPIAFSRRNIRRKLDIVFSSDSEEELSSHEKPAVLNGLSSYNNQNSLPAVNSHFLIPSPLLVSASNDVGDLLLDSGEKVEKARVHWLEAADANHINSLAVGNSCNQPSALFAHSVEANLPEIKHHSRELLDLNNSYHEEPWDSLNQFNEELSQTREIQMGVCSNLFPLMPHGHKENSTMGTAENYSSLQPNHIGEVKVAEKECRIAGNHCSNPLSDLLQQHGQTNSTVNRCLFPHPASVDPSYAIGNLGNGSTEGLFHCRDVNRLEYQDSGTVANRILEGADSLNPLFEQSPYRAKANTENVQLQQPPFTSLNPFSFTALGVSTNSLGDHLSLSAEPKGNGKWHQGSEAGVQSLKLCTTLGGPLSQSNGQCPKSEEMQQQLLGSEYVNHTLCLLPDDSLKPIEQPEPDSVFFQSPRTSNIDFTGCLADGNSMRSLGGKALKSNDEQSEEQQHRYVDAKDFNRMNDESWSVDVSCVPESTYVPETELNDGTETLGVVDMMDIVSPVTTIDVNTSTLRLNVPEIQDTGIDINVNARSEDMGDSQSDCEHLEASTSGCQVMDECSRMDFFKKPKRLRRSRLESKFPVQEKWNELRLTDLKQYHISEHDNAVQMLDLAFGVNNLISEGDLLLRDCGFVINDSSIEDTSLSEETFTFGWHDQQVQMTLGIAEHGYCLYAKDINALQLKMGTDYSPILAWDLLTSTNNSMTLGKLLRLNRSEIQPSLGDRRSKLEAPIADCSITRDRKTCLQNVAQSIAPLRSYLALRGNALHDYVSSLAHISKSEASRLAEDSQKTKRRRVRASKNYLSSGGLDLSPEDISLLNQYNSYGKFSS